MKTFQQPCRAGTVVQLADVLEEAVANLPTKVAMGRAGAPVRAQG